jgi:hypothetical protein
MHISREKLPSTMSQRQTHSVMIDKHDLQELHIHTLVPIHLSIYLYIRDSGETRVGENSERKGKWKET